MDALLSMLIDLSRTFLHDVCDIQELSPLNEKLENTLNEIIVDSTKKSELNDLLRQYCSQIMMLYSKYPRSTFLDNLMHRIESLRQIANTVDGKL